MKQEICIQMQANRQYKSNTHLPYLCRCITRELLTDTLRFTNRDRRKCDLCARGIWGMRSELPYIVYLISFRQHIFRARFCYFFLVFSFHVALVMELWQRCDQPTKLLTVLTTIIWMWSVPYFVSNHLKQYVAAHFSSSHRTEWVLLMSDCFQFYFIATVSLSVSDHCITCVRWNTCSASHKYIGTAQRTNNVVIKIIFSTWWSISFSFK